MKKIIFIVSALVLAVFTTLQAHQSQISAKKILKVSLNNIELYTSSEGIRGAMDCESNCQGDFWGRCNKATLNGIPVVDCQSTTSNGNCCGIKSIIEEYK